MNMNKDTLANFENISKLPIGFIDLCETAAGTVDKRTSSAQQTRCSTARKD
jgi:hypothetical protein